jgi:hypothetical protein
MGQSPGGPELDLSPIESEGGERGEEGKQGGEAQQQFRGHGSLSFSAIA